MRFIILLATLCLAAAYPSDDNSEFVNVEDPKSMESSNTAESSAHADASSGASNNTDDQDDSDTGPECTEDNKNLPNGKCGFFSCSKVTKNKYRKVSFDCPHNTCYDEESDSCEWKKK
ncbi:GSCOCG00005740001-RA-CDS [Cotesia congregata]|nr:GSCOCG00005740001-RA-CDS [Cotesia congregata]